MEQNIAEKKLINTSLQIRIPLFKKTDLCETSK